MVIEKILMELGLIKDQNNSKLQNIFKDNIKLSEIHIDIYAEHPLITSSLPFMLLSRVIEKNVIVENNNDRLVLKRNDASKTYILNILFEKIMECYYKELETCFEFILNIQNIYIRVIVYN